MGEHTITWTFHGLGVLGVTLPAADMVTLAEGHRYGTYLALYQALPAASGLLPSLCPDDCDRDHPRQAHRATGDIL